MYTCKPYEQNYWGTELTSSFVSPVWHVGHHRKVRDLYDHSQITDSIYSNILVRWVNILLQIAWCVSIERNRNTLVLNSTSRKLCVRFPSKSLHFYFTQFFQPHSSPWIESVSSRHEYIGTRILCRGKGLPAYEADVTAFCELVVYTMWELRQLTDLYDSLDCYRDAFNFQNYFLLGRSVLWSGRNPLDCWEMHCHYFQNERVNQVRNQKFAGFPCRLCLVQFLLGLLFDPEDGVNSYFPPKPRWTCTKLHDFTGPKAVVFIVTDFKNSAHWFSFQMLLLTKGTLVSLLVT
jgi:hypothetical protein